METIFDHNPTQEELEDIGCIHSTKEQFEKFDPESNWFALALLFRLRFDKKNEARAWSHIPERRDEFLRGFDVEFIDD